MTGRLEFILCFTYKVLAAESPNSARKIFVCCLFQGAQKLCFKYYESAFSSEQSRN